jgi:hypothetical protein
MEGPDGCKAKGGTVKLSFGGVNIAPQLVTIKDNSTGTFGFGRELVTPTSQISDTIYGQTLPEIWHNDDGIPQGGLPVQCRMVDGREESDFYEGLGIVGRGPIGGYTTPQMYDSDGDGIAETFLGSTLDGQPHHGFTQTNNTGGYTDSGLGLRKANGDDPVVANDYFSLDRTAGTPGPGEITALGGSSIVLDNYAAGVAFLVIRRTDPKGIQPSEISSHQMTAMIAQGLKGWSWGAPGSRAEVAGLTNPFWVAINTFLRSLGREKADAVIQEDYFDVVAAAACGAVADTTVPSLVGGGTELQFRFKGKIDARKSLRDRLTEILNNCLGYYTFEFGKLKLGIRSSATPETNFAAGNMLFGSLKLTPLKPDFEKLTVEFADTEFLFKQNTVDYTDLDFALRHNRVQNPKNSQIGLIGCSTKSQAGRIAVIRTREELGGVGVAEQKNARTATWRTTVLGLDTQAGQVVGLTDPDVPGGSGAFRIQSWRLNRDWSLDITAKTVTASMYDLSVGSVAVDVTATRQPTQSGSQALPPAPLFSGQVAPDDPTSAEVYNLHFGSTFGTDAITQGVFTFHYHNPKIVGDPTKTKVISTSWPNGFFTITPPATTYQQAVLDWVLKASLPGMNVTQIDGFVTNAYGNSPVTSISVNLQLADVTTNPVSGSGGSSNATFGSGTWYGQVPRGTKDGSNRAFALDYTLGSPFTLLSLNGIVQKPPRDGAGTYPGPDYAISGATLTYNIAPDASDWHYIWYINGTPPSTTTLPGLTAPIAVVYLISEHIPNPSSGVSGGGAGFNDTVGLFSPPSWMHDGSAWAKRTDTHTLTDTEYATLLDGSLYLLLDEYHIGSAVGPFDTPDQWRIYDAYIVVTHPNGTVETWRPTAFSVNPDTFSGRVDDPGFAIDGSGSTYALLHAKVYGLAFDGAFLNLNTWVSSNPGVDQVNGGGNTPGNSGAPGNTATADLIAADMVGPSDGSPHGWPFSTSPVVNSLPSGMSFLEWWSDLYVDAAGNPATNSRITVRNVQMWWLNTATSQWVNGFGPTNSFDGGYYNEDFSGTQLSSISFVDTPDGRGYATTAGKVAHTFAPFPRVQIDPANFGGVVVVAEAKLALINPTGTDDRSTAKYLFQVGADPYPSGNGPGIDNNTALVASKFKSVTSAWQSFSATTLSQSALEANPPRVDLTDLAGSGGSGSAGGTSGSGSSGSSGAIGSSGTSRNTPAKYFVSTSGSDSNAGTSSGAAWATFGHAVSVAGAGDIVEFANGTYGNEGHSGLSGYVADITAAGTSSNPIVFRAANVGGAVLDGGGVGGPLAFFNFGGSAAWIVVDGFVIQNVQNGFWNNSSAHDITIRNCVMHNIGFPTGGSENAQGMYAGESTSNLTIDSCVFHDIGRRDGSTTSLDHGLYLKTNGITVVNSIFYNQVNGWDIQLAIDASNILIANNVFASQNPSQNGQIILWDTNHTNVVFRNNIFVNPRSTAVYAYFESVNGGSMDHNIITNGSTPYSGSDLSVGSNLINVNPLFTNAGSHDYTLQAGSPAIDAGTAIGGLNHDFAGNLRPIGSGIDIGAYEHS